MTERVVDFLEIVEIEAEHRELVAVLGEAQGLIELLAKQRPVRQIGQRVMARHVRNLFLRLLPFGDVLERRHPAAAPHRLIDDADRASSLNDGLGQGVAGFCFDHQSGEELLGIAVPFADRLLMPEHVKQRTSLKVQAGPSHHLAVALIEQHDAAFGIEHAEALRHVFNCGIQHDLLLVQFALRTAVDHGGDQRDAENGECRNRRQIGERGRRDIDPVDDEGGIWHEGHRAHRGEVMGNDSGRQQHGRRRGMTKAVAARSDDEASAANTHPNRTDAATIPGDHTMRAGSCSANMPV